ncbi:hypothetical protein QBC43DRAFT_328896 [Cladorrhinum sp. PSN259]|nr:hypothetical protein QBC43DRAFT_328896 [Cladorrhinum sp. PSN259]
MNSSKDIVLSGASANNFYNDAEDDDINIISTKAQGTPVWSGSAKAMAKQKSQHRKKQRNNKAALQRRFDYGFERQDQDFESPEFEDELGDSFENQQRENQEHDFKDLEFELEVEQLGNGDYEDSGESDHKEPKENKLNELNQALSEDSLTSEHQHEFELQSLQQLGNPYQPASRASLSPEFELEDKHTLQQLDDLQQLE